MAETWRADDDNDDCCILIESPDGWIRLHIDPSPADERGFSELHPWESASFLRAAILADHEKAQLVGKAVEALREIKTLAAGAYGSRAGEHTRIKNIASAFLTTLDQTGDAT